MAGTFRFWLQNLKFLFLRRDIRFFFSAGGSALKAWRRQPVLRTLDIELTYACPLRCVQCYSYRERISPSLWNAELLYRIGAEARRCGAIHLNLSGGEPLLLKDLPELIAVGNRLGFLVSLCTSGFLLDERKLRDLAKAGLHLLLLSLDSLDPKTHDTNRGIPGLWERVITIIENRKHHGIAVMINTVATKEKLQNGEILKMAEWAHSQGILLNLTVPTPMGRWEDQLSVLLSPQDRQAFFALLNHPAVRSDFVGSYHGIGCPAGGEKISLDPYGNARACPLLPRVYGNVLTTPLASLWEKMRNDPALPFRYPFCPAGAQEYQGTQEGLFGRQRLLS